MRQSLSLNVERRSTGAAVALSVLLLVVAVVDQVGGHSLREHATAVYAPYGKRPGSGLLYGLVYTVAVLDALLWSAVGRAVAAGGRSAPLLGAAVVAVTAGLAAVLLATSEYGQQIFPARWGILALLPAAAGLVAVVRLATGRRPRERSVPQRADRR